MADLDSRTKRNSGVNTGLSWTRPLPLPDSTVGEGDRQHVAGYYSGISASATALASGGATQALWWPQFDED